DLSKQIGALGHFRSPRALEWMEARQDRASMASWGAAAALSRITWSKVTEWLEGGRPLSLVALVALGDCLDRDSWTWKWGDVPILEGIPAVEEMTTTLTRYAARDAVPN